MQNTNFVVLEADSERIEFESGMYGYIISGYFETKEEALNRMNLLMEEGYDDYGDYEREHQPPDEFDTFGTLGTSRENNTHCYYSEEISTDEAPLKLLELSEPSALYIIWHTDVEEPWSDYKGFLTHFTTAEEAHKTALDSTAHKMHGTVQDLSDDPDKLLQLIEKEDSLHYNPAESSLSIDPALATTAMPLLNALLLKPLYEVRKMTPAKIMALEVRIKHLNQLEQQQFKSYG